MGTELLKVIQNLASILGANHLIYLLFKNYLMVGDTKEIEESDKKGKRLKYQSEIDALKLTLPCPINLSSIESDLEVYRFCHNPINEKIDFLPNVVYDRISGLGYDYSANNTKEAAKCLRCGASFFTNLVGIINRWRNISPQIQENLGYAAIAKGLLKSEDGLIGNADRGGHFGFYEYEGATFYDSFTITESLP